MSTVKDIRMKHVAVIAAFAALGILNRTVSADAAINLKEALRQSAAGLTIPLSKYSVDSTKDGGHYEGVLVGGDPFSGVASPVTIDVVVIPLEIGIITADDQFVVFDPTLPNTCDGGVSAVERLKHSPLVETQERKVNDVDVGNVQYVNGIMRAEFWNASTNPMSLDDRLHWIFKAPLFRIPPIPPELGSVDGDYNGCGAVGIVTKTFLFEEMRLAALTLQAEGVVSPTQLLFFLLRDVVTSPTEPPVNEGEGGSHSAFGNPIQTFAWAPYLTNYLDAAKGKRDIHSISHEIGEWMNDPLAGLIFNKAPPWNATPGPTCLHVFEVGDPIEEYSVDIETDGYHYHPQELAFFSWFFNGPTIPSIGAGGKFSSHGHFEGPAAPCPPGGTFP
jgi:hypothetical protein